MGNRVAKHNYDNSGAWLNSTYYVRDAQGNVMGTYYNEPIAGPSVSYREAERPLYGSSRLGLDKNEVELIGASTLNLDSAKRVLGNKQYELSNHLGNVLATVSDKKIPIDEDSDNALDYYIPELLTSTDYYAFGQPMPGRNYTNGSAYRYAFNGQEKDDEIYGDGNAYTSTYWEYDPRLGRRWNLDPVPQTNMSEYVCFDNNPIMMTDINGDQASGSGDRTLPGEDIPDNSPLKSKNSTPKVQISIGNNFALPDQNNGHSDHHPAMIYSNDASFYQTDIHHPLSLTDKGPKKNDATEGNHVLEVKFRIGDTHIQWGFLGYKEKKESDANGYGIEASGPLLFTQSLDIPLFNNGKSGYKNFRLNLNIGVGGGFAVGAPRLNGKLYSGGLGGYRIMGGASAAILKIDVHFLSRFVFSIMATGTNMRIKGFPEAPQGSQGDMNYSTAAFKGLLGMYLYKRK